MATQQEWQELLDDLEMSYQEARKAARDKIIKLYTELQAENEKLKKLLEMVVYFMDKIER